MNTEEFKTQLLDMKSTITNRIEALSKDKTRVGGPIEADSSEQAQTIQNDEVVDHLDDLERAELTQIDAALSRIESGTFGECISCGESIGNKRLKALPFATICMNCNEEQNS